MKEKEMTFYDFMMANYLNSDTPEGDLAYDMERDCETFPRCEKDGYDTIIRYLHFKNACPDCLRVFKNCWGKYVKK